MIVYREELDLWQPGAHAGTFRGNQLAMAAGAATLAYVRENRPRRARRGRSAPACSPGSSALAADHPMHR